MKDRIKEIRKSYNLTQVQFGEKIGIKGNTVTNYETGLREPSNAVIASICREFQINERWLLNGEGEMRKQISEDEELSGLFSQLLRDDDDEKTTKIKKRVIANLLRLDVEDWKKITAFAQSILDEENNETE